MFGKVLSYVAGADHEIVAQCPRTDQIFICHLGFALVLTWIIVFSIVYFSFGYIGGTSFEFNASSNSFVTVQEGFSFFRFVITASLAAVVATIIVMFDRLLLMSDWFTHEQARNASSLLEYIASKISLFFKIAVRLALSLAISYILSLFLELRLYESQIVQDMQRAHQAENAALYARLSAQAEKYENHISDEAKRLEALMSEQSRLAAAPSGMTANANARLGDLEAQINGKNKTIETRQRAARASHNQEVKADRALLASLGKRVDSLNKQIAQYQARAKAEELGTNPEGLEGVADNPVRSCGPRCRYWQEKAEEVQHQLRPIQQQHNQVSRRIDAAAFRFERRSQQIADEVNRDVRASAAERQALLGEAKKTALERKAEIEKARAANEKKVNESRRRLMDLRNGREAASDKDRQSVINDPNYRPFSDGILDRAKAHWNLKHDEKYGQTVLWLSWMVKAFIIFLEIVPVVGKLFFSPKSSYGAFIGSRVEAAESLARIDAYDAEEYDLINGRKEKALEKKRRSAELDQELYAEKRAEELFKKAMAGG